MSGELKPILSWRGEIAKAGLPPATKLVAYGLSLYMNERGGSAHPGPTRLAAETGLNVSTVKERLAALERAGWLRCVERGGFKKGEKKHANIYEATFPDPTLLEARTVASDDGRLTRRSTQMKATVASGDPICPSISPIKIATNNESEPSGRRKRRVPLPEVFVMTAEMRVWAEENAPTVDVDLATEEFVTYWRGDGGAKADWVQTWRNWLLKLARPTRWRTG